MIQAVVRGQAEFVAALKQGEEKKVTLIDNRGIGKPEQFTGKDEEYFLRWKIKLEVFIFSVFPEMEAVMNWADGEEKTSTEFGEGT